MPNTKRETLLAGLESTRGTVASTFDWDVHLVGAFERNLEHGHAQIDGNAYFPDPAAQEAIGQIAQPRVTPDININTIRDLILLLTSRTSGALPSISLRHDVPDADEMNFLGCVASELSLNYSRGATPGNEDILQGTLGLECMQAAGTTGISAGTKPVGNRFKMSQASFSINSVSALEVVSYSRTMRVALDLGGLNSSGKRIYIVDGMLEQEVTLRARFTSDGWRSIVSAGSAVPVVIVHGTGTANETVTETIGAAKIQNHTIAEDGNTRMEEITIRNPPHTGAAAACVWTFGSSIGASVLGL